MNHLLRSLAPISDAGWSMLDEEARQRLAPALAARKLVDFSGPHGWDYSATNLGRINPADRRAVRRRIRAAAAGAAAGRGREPTSSCRGRSCATATAAPTTPTSRRSTRPRIRSRWPRTWPCSTAGTARCPVSRRPPRTTSCSSATTPTSIAARSRRGRAVASQRHHRAVRAGAWSRAIPACRRDGRARAATRCWITSAGSSSGPIVWAPGRRGRRRGQPPRRRLPVRIRPGPVDRLRLARRRAVRLYLEESFSFHVATPEAAVVLKADSAPASRPTRARAPRRSP